MRSRGVFFVYFANLQNLFFPQSEIHWESLKSWNFWGIILLKAFSFPSNYYDSTFLLKIRNHIFIQIVCYNRVCHRRSPSALRGCVFNKIWPHFSHLTFFLSVILFATIITSWTMVLFSEDCLEVNWNWSESLAC